LLAGVFCVLTNLYTGKWRDKCAGATTCYLSEPPRIYGLLSGYLYLRQCLYFPRQKMKFSALHGSLRCTHLVSRSNF